MSAKKGLRKLVILSFRTTEEFEARLRKIVSSSIEYDHMSDFIRDAVEKKVNGRDPRQDRQLEQIERHVRRVAGTLARLSHSGTILSPQQSRKLAKITQKVLLDAAIAFHEAC